MRMNLQGLGGLAAGSQTAGTPGMLLENCRLQLFFAFDDHHIFAMLQYYFFSVCIWFLRHTATTTSTMAPLLLSDFEQEPAPFATR